jgi:Xaa-Pro dipeptidase
MHASRREWLRDGTAAVLGAGFLSRVERVAALQPAPPMASDTLRGVLSSQATGKSEALLLGPAKGEEGPPKPATYDRLPLQWNKAVTQRLKDKLAARDIQAFMVRDPLNITYLTGYWHTTTERPQVVFMNRDDADPWFFYPALDRDIVKSWWFGDGRMYFDFLHAEEAFPERGSVQSGDPVDLFEFLLRGIKQKGVQGDRIGIDGELYPSEQAKADDVLPKMKFVNIRDLVLRMRQIKTPEELALWRRAYVYFDRAHAFARDYLLTHGTDVTDYEIAAATELWINDLLYRDLDLANGAAHHGVASGVRIAVRAGPVTAYPHPNQPYFNRIGRNTALQVSGIARIGGYGHENYRAFILADSAGRFAPHMAKLWEVSKNCCDLQVELSSEGVSCSHVARKIHEYQVKEGVQDYVYHRPAHGAGTEGHQAPYLALGDYTMLRRNMCFSQEPGLYDQARGCGFNWSDTVVVGERSGWRMSRVPYSKEWCWVKL